jgi:divinyl protochlorophyllide a 8-vinyl-reductase
VADAPPEAAPPARVGPNAAIQLFAALRRRDEALARTVAQRAGLASWLDAPPQEMIAETSAARLHQTVRAVLPVEIADAALAEAGRTTADYLLKNRIPGFAQFMLRAAPAGWAARGLSRAIRANAWTFAGSGRFSAAVDEAAIFEIYDNPFCAGLSNGRKLCVWHSGVFERLFQTLVSPHARAHETACCAAGSPCCRFLLTWKRP